MNFRLLIGHKLSKSAASPASLEVAFQEPLSKLAENNHGLVKEELIILVVTGNNTFRQSETSEEGVGFNAQCFFRRR